MAFLLGRLCSLQGRVGGLEIGTGILPVSVEEEIVKPPVKVVMVGDILLRVHCLVRREAPGQRKRSPEAPQGASNSPRLSCRTS